MWDERKFGGRQTQPYCVWSQEYTHWSFVLTTCTIDPSFLLSLSPHPPFSVSLDLSPYLLSCHSPPSPFLPFSLSSPSFLPLLSFLSPSLSPLLPFSLSSPSFSIFLFSQLKVTHKQLALLLGAFAAYFSGNHTAIEGFMKEFHSKIQELQSNRDPPEWLEELPSPQDQQSN